MQRQLERGMTMPWQRRSCDCNNIWNAHMIWMACRSTMSSLNITGSNQSGGKNERKLTLSYGSIPDSLQIWKMTGMMTIVALGLSCTTCFVILRPFLTMLTKHGPRSMPNAELLNMSTHKTHCTVGKKKEKTVMRTKMRMKTLKIWMSQAWMRLIGRRGQGCTLTTPYRCMLLVMWVVSRLMMVGMSMQPGEGGIMLICCHRHGTRL